MAFGNYSNNAGAKKQGPFDPTVYSPYKFNNARSAVDQTRLSIQFWNNSMRIMISPKAADSPEDQPTFDDKNSISIYLNHTKARMLSYVIRGFIEDPAKFDNCGVTAGTSLLTISTGKEFNSKFPLIIIRKVSEDGSVSASFAYEIKGDFHRIIRGFDQSNGHFDEQFYPNLELEQLITALEEFYKAETRAIAYSIQDQLKFDLYRTNTRISRIGEKLGVDMGMGSQSGSGSSSSTSYFSKSNSSSTSPTSFGDTSAYESATLDDIY